MLFRSGTAPYSYIWSNGETTQNLAGLFAGNYSVSVTDTNGCTTSASAAVSNQNVSFSLAETSNPATCTAANGSIELSVSGGTAPYIYAWSNGEATSAISALSVGTYSITITDANGCATTAAYNVIATNASVCITETITPAICTAANGSISLSVSEIGRAHV